MIEEKKEELRIKRFMNGWSKEQERLMSEWSDMASCYRWIHDKSDKFYHNKSLWINLPVIILTTLGGTASFGVQSIFTDNTSKQYASFAIGSISLFAGVLTTIGNYLRYAQLEESHRVASITWGKFQRLIAIELALHPLERMDSLDFLKICRSDLDRLIEQSPPIPEDAIYMFEERFSGITKFKKPDICGALEHTRVFENSDERLKQLAVDASFIIKHKKNMLQEIASPQIQYTIQQKVKQELDHALDERKQRLEEEIRMNQENHEKNQYELDRIMTERHLKIEEEINLDKKRIKSFLYPSFLQKNTKTSLTESPLCSLLSDSISPVNKQNEVVIPIDTTLLDKSNNV